LLRLCGVSYAMKADETKARKIAVTIWLKLKGCWQLVDLNEA
jgi:hypothetical protein